MERIVFDAWPLMAYFDNEPAAEAVERLFHDSEDNARQKIISVINLGEIWYNYARIYSPDFSDDLAKKIGALKFKTVPVNWKLARIAAELKAGGGLSYADCFAAALARQNNAPLVTGDPEFERLEKEIEIIWL